MSIEISVELDGTQVKVTRSVGYDDAPRALVHLHVATNYDLYVFADLGDLEHIATEIIDALTRIKAEIAREQQNKNHSDVDEVNAALDGEEEA